MGICSLHFDPAKFPRTIGRKQWATIWRWKRETQRKLNDQFERDRTDLACFGSTMPTYRRRQIIEGMVIPPLLIHGRQQV